MQSDCTRWRNEIFSFKIYCNSICLQTLPFYSKAEADVQDFVYATLRNVDSLVIFEALQLSLEIFILSLCRVACEALETYWIRCLQFIMLMETEKAVDLLE